MTMNRMRPATIYMLMTLWITLLLSGCVASELKPVDIFPEDMCSNCRMAVSDERFASEIIADRDEVYKFDDIGCFLKFREKRIDLKIVTIFMKDYESKQWIPYDGATIVETDVETPMGSGKVAFSDSKKASEFAKQHPKQQPLSAQSGCSGNCCSEEKE